MFDCTKCIHYDICCITQKETCVHYAPIARNLQIPCEIGDTVYVVVAASMHKDTVSDIAWHDGEFKFFTKSEFIPVKLGQNMFLTEEEAQVELEKRKEFFGR